MVLIAITTDPNETTLNQTATTNSSSVATWTVTADGQSSLGTYIIRADANLDGYTSSTETIIIQFIFKDDIPEVSDALEVPIWASNIDYRIGDKVSYEGNTYACVIAHASLTEWEPPIDV